VRRLKLEGAAERGTANAWSGDVQLTGTNLLLYRREGLRMRADVDLKLSGSQDRPLLGGNVMLTSGMFNRPIDYLGALQPGGSRGPAAAPRTVLFPDPPLRDLRFDVHIGSKAPFVFRTAYLRGRLFPDLHLGGTGELPELSGRVRLDRAKLRLPGGVLDFDGGAIVFNRNQPEQARLNLRGTGRMFDHDVTALVEGTVAAPQITLSSIPPLAGDTLAMMLLTGTPPPRGNQEFDANAELKLAVFVGRDILTRLFEEDEAESWGQVLDRFEVEMGRGITQSGEETVNARFRLADNVWREGHTIYITGERDAFDYYNAGLRFVLRFK
jgi:translocation and assembly module TamB